MSKRSKKEKKRAPLELSPPSGIGAALLIARLTLRRATRGTLIKVVAALLLLPAAAGILALVSGRGGRVFFDMIVPAYLRYLLPLVLALQAATSVADEVQGKTLWYLFSRPMPRWSLPLGKYIGTVIISVVLCVGSMIVTYLCGMGSEIGSGFGSLARAIVAAALAAAHFGAVATAFGAMVVTYPFVAMMLYVLLVDVALGLIPGVIKVGSMGIHLTVVAGLYTPHSKIGWAADPNISVPVALLVIAGVTITWLIVALSFVSSHEYRITDQ